MISHHHTILQIIVLAASVITVILAEQATNRMGRGTRTAARLLFLAVMVIALLEASYIILVGYRPNVFEATLISCIALLLIFDRRDRPRWKGPQNDESDRKLHA